MNANSPASVNPHYLEHVVVAAARGHEVETADDIISSGGTMLLVKGSRVDAAVRERLLQHKLRRPLEGCLQIADGVDPKRLGAIGEALLERYPLLRALCASGSARPAPEALAALALSVQVRSLLTIFVQIQNDRLDHAVGVAMLAMSLARRLRPDEGERHRQLAVAGLLHDVGELYIDPAYLRRDKRLDAQAWRHIVTHPLVGHRVLRDMAGAGEAVADAVLLHHERLDGFGYPRGIAGAAFTLDGQILAVAEWLMALVETDSSPLARARMASQLVPGEFSAPVLAAVSAAACAAADALPAPATAVPLVHALPRIERLAGTLQRFQEQRAWLEAKMALAAPGLHKVLEAGVRRMQRIQSSFSSTGLDAHDPERLLAEFAASGDPRLRADIMVLIDELEWRMHQCDREQRLRASLLPDADRAVVEELLDGLRTVGGELPRRDDQREPRSTRSPMTG
ncbi:HD-GYP domain-containing protein [Variovorax sp. JS1663]|uniref:HD-GYP domain-containing protein n=1 Tax=Variovorax sp. JS1663 TaxID=1851577 RepID=UPI000B341AA0|nr:HD domain-containing phosphohydrolase [Variovorax sp. JS1663]OUM00927.1 hypothetical protein A8M77_18675 [Variovorax sp. JS1663]